MRLARYTDHPVFMLTPLLVWGTYFLVIYIVVAITCARQPAVQGLVLPFLWLLSAAAVLVTVLVGLSFARRLRQGDEQPPNRTLLLGTGLLLSLISLVAIAWTALPTLFLAPCD